MVKKIVAFSLLLVLIFLPVSYSGANANNVIVYVDENKMAFPDAQPYIDTNGRTMIPVRFPAQAFGADVTWNQANKTATISSNAKVVKVTVGSTNYSVNGEQRKMDTVAILKDSRTFVPLRFISEALGVEVDWRRLDNGKMLVFNFTKQQSVAKKKEIIDTAVAKELPKLPNTTGTNTPTQTPPSTQNPVDQTVPNGSKSTASLPRTNITGADGFIKMEVIQAYDKAALDSIKILSNGISITYPAPPPGYIWHTSITARYDATYSSQHRSFDHFYINPDSVGLKNGGELFFEFPKTYQSKHVTKLEVNVGLYYVAIGKLVDWTVKDLISGSTAHYSIRETCGLQAQEIK